MEPKTKYFFAEVKTINEQERTIDFIASTIDIDRDGEIILPEAFAYSIESFKANPVMLCCHQHRLPSGSSSVIGSIIPESIMIGKTEIPMRGRFATTPLGEEYWILYRDKHMRGISVGFIPVEGEWRDIQGRKLYVHTKIELLEISAVPVPSNRAALARAKGYFENEDIKDSIAVAVKEQLTDLKLFVEQSLDDIKSMIIANSGGLADHLLGDGFELPEPGGDEQKLSEQILQTCQEITEKI